MLEEERTLHSITPASHDDERRDKEVHNESLPHFLGIPDRPELFFQDLA
jgi:hypothetical protein